VVVVVVVVVVLVVEVVFTGSVQLEGIVEFQSVQSNHSELFPLEAFHSGDVPL